LPMNQSTKQALTDKWLLVLNEYELIKQRKNNNIKTVNQLM